MLGPETKENPGKVRWPGGSGAACLKGVLEAAMEALDHAIGLWVVGGGLPVLYLQQNTQ